jgi:hypothetical protein
MMIPRPAVVHRHDVADWVLVMKGVADDPWRAVQGRKRDPGPIANYMGREGKEERSIVEKGR